MSKAIPGLQLALFLSSLSGLADRFCTAASLQPCVPWPLVKALQPPHPSLAGLVLPPKSYAGPPAPQALADPSLTSFAQSFFLQFRDCRLASLGALAVKGFHKAWQCIATSAPVSAGFFCGPPQNVCSLFANCSFWSAATASETAARLPKAMHPPLSPRLLRSPQLPLGFPAASLQPQSLFYGSETPAWRPQKLCRLRLRL